MPRITTGSGPLQASPQTQGTSATDEITGAFGPHHEPRIEPSTPRLFKVPEWLKKAWNTVVNWFSAKFSQNTRRQMNVQGSVPNELSSTAPKGALTREELKTIFPSLKEKIDKCDDQNILGKISTMVPVYQLFQEAALGGSISEIQIAVNDALDGYSQKLDDLIRRHQDDTQLDDTQLQTIAHEATPTTSLESHMIQINQMRDELFAKCPALKRHIDECKSNQDLQIALNLSSLLNRNRIPLEQGTETYGAMVSALNGDHKKANQIIQGLSSQTQPTQEVSSVESLAVTTAQADIPKWQEWKNAADKFTKREFNDPSLHNKKVYLIEAVRKNNQEKVRELLIDANYELVLGDQEALEIPVGRPTKNFILNIEERLRELRIQGKKDEATRLENERYNLSKEEQGE